MREHRTTRFSLTAAFGLGLAAAFMAAPARAADENVPLDTKILRSILGELGLKRPGEGEINYQERAPLVIPPAQELPPPQQSGAAIANNPAWPKDPDVARAKLSAKEEDGYGSVSMIEREQNPLPPNELAPGASRNRTARGTIRPGNAQDIGTDPSRLLSPQELGYRGGLFNFFSGKEDSEAAKFTGEPPRTSLTDPPAGYRTPSPEQPYGIGQAASKPRAINSYETRVEGQ